MEFKGFSKETIKFLFELGFNNNKDWYTEHKNEYLEYVLEPFKKLVKSLGKKMLEIDPEFEITPAVDKTISRIYRDTRFSNDKTKYRNNVWISFKRPVVDWKETPVYFFEIYPEFYHFGMGFFQFPASVREKLRKSILENTKTFRKVVSFYQKEEAFEIAGEKFKRIKDKAVLEELRNWYERKELYLYCRRKMDDLPFQEGLVDFLYDNFLRLKPLYDYLWDVIKKE